MIKAFEVDVVAHFRHGPLEFRVLVECKEYGARKLVSDLDMRSFLAKILAAREAGLADKGVFITTSSFTKTARATAAQHSITCQTLVELHDSLVDFTPHLEQSRSAFRASDLSKWYVEQAGSDIEDYENLAAQARDEMVHKPLTAYIHDIFFAENERRVALLGNFGTGKTSFCLRYQAELIERHLLDRSARIPIYIRLADFRPGLDIQTLVLTTMQRLQGVTIGPEAYGELQRRGRFLLLLDGLDEMATRVDRSVINENLREIERLATEGDNKYIVTCRTHFFQERIADDFLKGYRVVYLTEWGRPELREYLQLRFAEDAARYEANIYRSRKLEELSRTPILLEMLLKSLASDSARGVFDVQRLYANYTDEWIRDQSRRRGAVMSAMQRYRFAQALAVRLYAEGAGALHYSKLYDLAQEISRHGDAARIDYFDSDARTSTFIVKDSLGNYGFRHPSFAEYFVALAIMERVNSGDHEIIAGRELPSDVLGFVSPQNLDNMGRAHLKEWANAAVESTLSLNAGRIAIRAGVAVSEEAKRRLGYSEEAWRALLDGLNSDDPHVIESFAMTFYPKLRRYAYEMLRKGTPDIDADDIAQEAIIGLLNRRDRLSQVTNIDAYLRRYVRNMVLDRLRLSESRRRNLGRAGEFMSTTLAPAEQPSEVEEHVLAAQVIEKIHGPDFGPGVRDVLLLAVEGLTAVEISERLGLSRRVVAARMYRGRRQLQIMFDKHRS